MRIVAMVRAKLSVVLASLLVGAAALLTGCSSTPTKDATAGWSPNRLYKEAKDEMDSGAYDKAVVLYEKLEGRAAGTVLAQQAQLDKAYAHYRSNEPVLAIATLDRFIKLHPSNPALDYAYYLKGVVNFNDNLGMFAFLSKQDLSERDQKAAKESFETFKDLVRLFPNSKYALDARQRMTYIVDSLAQYEVHVARHYFQRGAYHAAVNRAQIAIVDYREVPANEEALYILFRSYDALDLPQLRDDAKRVLDKSFPNSRYLTRGFRKVDDPWWKVW